MRHVVGFSFGWWRREQGNGVVKGGETWGLVLVVRWVAESWRRRARWWDCCVDNLSFAFVKQSTCGPGFELGGSGSWVFVVEDFGGEMILCYVALLCELGMSFINNTFLCHLWFASLQDTGRLPICLAQLVCRMVRGGSASLGKRLLTVCLIFGSLDLRHAHTGELSLGGYDCYRDACSPLSTNVPCQLAAASFCEDSPAWCVCCHSLSIVHVYGVLEDCYMDERTSPIHAVAEDVGKSCRFLLCFLVLSTDHLEEKLSPSRNLFTGYSGRAWPWRSHEQTRW